MLPSFLPAPSGAGFILGRCPAPEWPGGFLFTQTNCATPTKSRWLQSQFWRTPSLYVGGFRSRRFRRQGKMSSRLHELTRGAAIAAMLTFSAQAVAQSDD